LGCLWYLIGHLVERYTDLNTWTVKANFNKSAPDRPSFGYIYLTCLHWALTQLTPAGMSIVPVNFYERLYVCLVIIFSVVMLSSLISQISQAMTRLRENLKLKNAEERRMRTYFVDHGIRGQLMRSTKHFMKLYHSIRERHVKEKDIECFQYLPKRVQDDLREEAFLPCLVRHPFFCTWNGLDPDASRKLCSAAIEEVFFIGRR